MPRLILVGLLCLYLFLLQGCSYVLVDSDILKENPQQPIIDPNIWPVKIIGTDKPVSVRYPEFILDLKQPCRLKYSPCRGRHCPTMVTGQLSEGRKYQVIIDSGHPFSIVLSDRIIVENNLPIYPIKDEQAGGICYLPSLQLGEAAICNAPCMYRNKQWQLQALGIPLAREKFIIAGLWLMQRFRYILLDGVRKESEISAKQSFAPDEPDNWSKYSCMIEKDKYHNDRLMVDIPIAGESLHIMLDTGCTYGLTTSSQLWARISERVEVQEVRDSKKSTYQAKEIPCKEMVIAQLNVANQIINSAQVLVLPPDNQSNMPSHLGMGYFKDTVVVLDFERNLMWVKNNGAN